VIGTVEVDADKLNNWVGGTDTVEAAISLIGQGGIPNLAVTSGGKIAKVRLEHAWVKAYVNWIPARGAKNYSTTQHINANPSLNAWVDVDTSYKQYAATRGLDLATQVPLDANAFVAAIQEGATVDTTQGFVQNLNQDNLQAQLAAYESRVQSHINNSKPNATVGDVLGTHRIVATSSPVLAGSLPYATRLSSGGTVRTEVAMLADSLRWKFKTSLAASAFDFYFDGTGDLIEYRTSTAKLAAKKITLSFVPATQADADLIASYLPSPNPDGSPIRPEQLPTSLPGYLLNLKAELRIDGQVVAQSPGTVTMGQELLQASGFYSPGHGQWFEGEPNKPLAGEYHAIATDLQGTSPAQLEGLKTKLNATKAALEAFQANPADTTPIQNLTKEDLTGDLLYSGVLGYFASVDGNARLAARAGSQVMMQRLPSFGAFAATVTPNYFFGIVRSVGFEALAMDIDQLFYQVAAKDNDPGKRWSYLRQVGTADSGFEHAVPEQLLKDPSKGLNDPTQPQAVSAVKALAIASAQGQKIYTLHAQNQGQHQTILASLNQSAALKAEIGNALAAGKEVTVHEARIDAFGFKGAGYIIIDPETGAGAYKIESGANGANVTGQTASLGFIALAGLLLAVVGVFALYVGLWLIWLLAIAATIALVIALLNGGIDAPSDLEKVVSALTVFVAIALALSTKVALVLLGLANIMLAAWAFFVVLVLLPLIYIGYRYWTAQERRQSELVSA
jgi:hypothetical protein